MRLKSLKIKERVLTLLTKAIENEAFGSPFIIEAPDRQFAYETALAFAHEILLSYSSATTKVKLEKDSHPDFFVFRPEGARSMHSISDIKRLIDDAILPPFEGKYKVYLIADAEAMLPVHANALLKTLEDKAEHTVILLSVTETTHLLPTILSRCKVISLDEAGTDQKRDEEFEQNVIDLIAHAWTGHISKALARVSKVEKVIDEKGIAKLEEMLDIILTFHRDVSIKNPDSRYKEMISQISEIHLPSFNKMNEILAKAHLSYQRHVKIKTIVEMVSLAPLINS